MLPKGLPERTLGWDILDWGSQMLAQPDENANYIPGDNWRYSDEQAMFILWFYAVDEHGKYIYRNAVLERPKGWGKSPLLAAICCTELLGPVVFDGWDADGRPVGRPARTPLVQIAAISDSQANNTMDLVRQMLAEGDALYYYPHLEINLSKVTYPGGKKLEKVTASPRGREGNRATFIVMDETHLWVPAEKGPELFEALDRNLAKMNKRWIATTNAPMPGEGSVAEFHHDGYDKMIAGETLNNDLLFDTREVYVENIYDPETAIPALRYVYGDAMQPETGWIDFDAIWSRINSPLTRESVARRMYFNQRTTGDSNWLHKNLWIDCKNSTISLKPTDKIAIGFKGNTKRGAAIVACRLTDKALFSLGWWENPIATTKDSTSVKLPDWEVPFTQIDSKIRKVLANYPVYKLLADPTQYQDVVGRWHSDFEDEVEEFWISTKTKMAKAVEQFESAVYSKRLCWKDDALSRHVMNSHIDEVPAAPRDDGSPGQVIRQENKNSFRYIFGAQAAVLALEAAVIAIEEGALNESDGTLYIF